MDGKWITAGTTLDAPYPCLCRPTWVACHPIWCPCAGRVDTDPVPPWCCGHRVRPHHVAEALRDWW